MREKRFAVFAVPQIPISSSAGGWEMFDIGGQSVAQIEPIITVEMCWDSDLKVLVRTNCTRVTFVWCNSAVTNYFKFSCPTQMWQKLLKDFLGVLLDGVILQSTTGDHNLCVSFTFREFSCHPSLKEKRKPWNILDHIKSSNTVLQLAAHW